MRPCFGADDGGACSAIPNKEPQFLPSEFRIQRQRDGARMECGEMSHEKSAFVARAQNDAITLGDPQRLELAGGAPDVAVQLGISERLALMNESWTGCACGKCLAQSRQ